MQDDDAITGYACHDDGHGGFHSEPECQTDVTDALGLSIVLESQACGRNSDVDDGKPLERRIDDSF